MDNLGIIELYEQNGQNSSIKEFKEKTNSRLKVDIKRKKATRDTEWLDIIEQTLPYIDNIFRTPNRFIINEEEIVKIEQAKKVTVETIKHLSKNTNLIQTVDEVTGDVTPSKLLNVRKEESYNTYENRLIYTLIQNTKIFMRKKSEALIKDINLENEEDKDNTKLEYNATSEVKDEKINVQVKLNSEADSSTDESKDKNKAILDKIEEIKRKIDVISNSEPYKVIDKLNITLVREPIRKTNVVLKNVNFQYAMKLWSYLRENYDGDEFEGADENKNYIDQGELKQFIDETFLLQYLAMKTIDEDKTENEVTYQELKEQIIEQMVEQIVDMEQDSAESINDINNEEQKIIQMISEKYEVIKYKKTEIIKEIQQIFKKHIEKYEEQVEKR